MTAWGSRMQALSKFMKDVPGIVPWTDRMVKSTGRSAAINPRIGQQSLYTEKKSTSKLGLGITTHLNNSIFKEYI